MSIRDLFLFAVMAILAVRIPVHPWIGAIAWVVFSVMNPHRLTWGPAFDFQFAQIIAILTMIGLLATKDHREIKGVWPMAVLTVLFIWMVIVNFFAFDPERSTEYLKQVFKIFLMTGVLLTVLHTRRHVDLLIWALVISLGFYGTKGGVFTIVTGGQFRVNGPDGSVMEGNNSLGVGLVVVIPLMLYLYQQSRIRWVRIALVVAAGLCSVSVLGSYSRGALLAIGAMCALLWLRSSNKIAILVAATLFIMVAIPAMPENWTARMHTIYDYEQEGSAMGRLIAWETAYNIAKARFPLAGGFSWESPAVSAIYSPDPAIWLVAHSVYFQVLGDLGFIGLAIFLLFWAMVWFQCAGLRRECRGRPDMAWAYSLASMIQVALFGFLVGGAFLNLAFWDLPYYLFTAIAVMRHIVRRGLATTAADASPAMATGVGMPVEGPVRG